MKIIPSHFYSNGILCDGELILPEKTSHLPPVIIMAHGFGFLRYFGVMKFAHVFLEYGIAVFTFDYRTLGFSEGDPRQMIDPEIYRDDFTSAIKHFEGLSEIDASKIGLFGCSFSTGPIFEAASKGNSVKAVSSIVPYMSTVDFVKKKSAVYFMIRAVIGYYDVIREKLGLKPFYVPIPVPFKAVKDLIGPDENNPDYPGVKFSCSINSVKRGREIIHIGVERKSDGMKTFWENKFPARSIVKMYYYHPYEILERVMCPVQLVAGTKDNISPIECVSSWSKNLKLPEIITFDGGHFDPYKVGIFENIARSQAEFFVKYLFT